MLIKIALLLAFVPAIEQQANDVVAALRSTISQLEAHIAELEKENEQLRARIEQLEAKLGDEKSENGDVGQVLQVMRIEIVLPENHQQLLVEASQHEKRNAKLEKDIASKQAEMIRRQGQRPYDQRGRDAQKRAVKLLQDQVHQLQQESRQANGNALRARREAGERRQIIYGWNGRSFVILKTIRDLSSALLNADAGSYLIWRGPLLELTEDGAVYEARSIELVVRPDGFKEYAPSDVDDHTPE